MTKAIWAALIGIAAGALLLGGYAAALRAGIHVRPEFVVATAAALAFAGTVAVFTLVTMDRPAYASPRATLPLNEEPATEYIYAFKGRNILPILARPGMSVGEVLVRHSDSFRGAPDQLNKVIAL